MHKPVSQLIRFLNNPDNYPEKTKNVQIIQTHASVVAVCDHYVYKLKKPVNFEFLNFSTLEKRRFYCEEELRLNSRLTDGIYIGVFPICLTDKNALTFENTGEEAEVVIKMRRMSEEGFLSFLVEKNLDSSDHYQLIVNHLCAFYKDQPPQALNSEYGTKGSISHIIRENKDIRRTFLGKTLHPIQESIIDDYQENFLYSNDTLFDKRIKEGWVRDVHGDLRLEHFHFGIDTLNIYDCIEFKERLRVNDVINDLAFLSMELEYTGRSAQSFRLFNQIMECIDDLPDYDLWRFYKVHRACVRGMVHAVAAYEEEVSEADKLRNHKMSVKLFGLATRYALLGNSPTVIVVFGGVATGKSTIAKALSEMLNVVHVQSDATRKELAGIPIDEYSDEGLRKKLYNSEMTTLTYNSVIEKGVSYIKSHNVVILDGRWSKPEQQNLILNAFKETKVYWIQTIASGDERKRRLKERESKKSISDARIDVFMQLLKSEDYNVKPENLIEVDTTNPIEVCLQFIFDSLKQMED